jgi:hypothetical protein
VVEFLTRKWIMGLSQGYQNECMETESASALLNINITPLSNSPFPPLAPIATLSPGLKIPPFSVMV